MEKRAGVIVQASECWAPLNNKLVQGERRDDRKVVGRSIPRGSS